MHDFSRKLYFLFAFLRFAAIRPGAIPQFNYEKFNNIQRQQSLIFKYRIKKSNANFYNRNPFEKKAEICI